ncbi:hypothetical protein GGQ64_005468 [Rhizobium azooxidifex]|uniref:Uncharacterized protein n=1 Tax=Mycoplana azooxidifex TaxID=1636188 RepID=A0A7W6DBI1_9HYPH|nr:hypothetical protein [Mycoplana azooxidifex]MBB3980215.1 hypothetical protein [Mycoplana azooxidifex]
MSRIEPASCFCGAITAEAVGEPFWINWDHGDDCRKAIEGLPAEVYLSIGFMDAPERFRPAAHGYWEQRLPCVEMNDGLPREERYTRPRQPGLGFPRDR